MTFEDLTDLIEKQGANRLKTTLQQFIQPTASKIEERIEYLKAKGYDGNEDIIEDIIEDAAYIVRKLRKHGVLV